MIMIIVLLLPATGMAADGGAVPLMGRVVADVIDEFRDAGHPFAYSTNLVSADLLVTAEPESTDPLGIVKEILRPHGLTIRTASGVYLVVRFNSDALPGESVALVVTVKGSDQPVQKARITADPLLPLAAQDSPGIYKFADVAPDRYQFIIEADGFEATRRIVDVWPGETTIVSVGMNSARPVIETIGVSASRYEILSELASSRFSLDQRTIQNMPDMGEDPMRIIQRLPGAAASGASAKTHFRGGEESEIGIMLNGHGLFDPFHIRDYQSIFSAIDSRAIEGVEVYTGGFPVRFGDLMSGLVLMESLESVQPRHTELGFSIFNTSFLTAGNEADRNWLVSARRGNLDLVINPEYGSPSYYDIFGEYSIDVSPSARLSVNALFADDRVKVVLETDPTELEKVTSRTRNAQVWLQLVNDWSSELTSRMVLSGVKFENNRNGSLGDYEKIVGSVHDIREFEEFRLRQDWSWTSSRSHLRQWGIEATYANAFYDYANSAEYYGLPALFEELPQSTSFSATAEPRGSSYSLYYSDRWRVSPKTVLELGLRWDDQTYTDVPSDSQLSPRISAMTTLGPKTELRFSWGRYQQSQGINDLQIEDGVTRFWPTQKSDHMIFGVRRLIRDKYALRVEMFRKEMHQVRPRFENVFDPLGLIPEIGPDRVFLDPSSALSKGVEISVDRSSGPLTWWATYTLAEATDRINGKNQYRSWDQRHAFQGGLAWSTDKWDVALAASVHSGWPTTELSLLEDGVDDQGEPVYVAKIGPRNVSRLHSFASVDFRVSRKWKLNRGSLMAFLEISNLSNRRNECCLDWDFEEDDITGEPFFELERGLEYWMPLLPAIGVLWEF
jgi:outer membrane receptor protein involved in Fe transport